MLELLKQRKEQLEARGEKGFTLMEMLIVIAIIAILIAIAIPIFTAQLENARDATSAANLRSAYAEASAVKLTEQDGANATLQDDGTVQVTGVVLQTTDNSLGDAGADLPFTLTGLTGANDNAIVTFTFETDGTVTGAIS